MMNVLVKVNSSFTESQNRALILRDFVDEKKGFFILKRISDVIFSSIVIVVFLSWMIPIIGMLILLDSRGPVFFVQRRVGRGGKTFLCLKFRTMVINDQANQKQAEENDSRITAFGKFLRRSNLDEVPQFLNVLLGHMSIVGPRPHMLEDCKKFGEVISDYKFRSMVRPGITGLAQIKGYRGPTKDFESIFKRFQYDAFYIRNINFFLELKIVRKTIAQTFIGLFSYFMPPFYTKQKHQSPAYKEVAA